MYGKRKGKQTRLALKNNQFFEPHALSLIKTISMIKFCIFFIRHHSSVVKADDKNCIMIGSNSVSSIPSQGSFFFSFFSFSFLPSSLIVRVGESATQNDSGLPTAKPIFFSLTTGYPSWVGLTILFAVGEF